MNTHSLVELVITVVEVVAKMVYDLQLALHISASHFKADNRLQAATENAGYMPPTFEMLHNVAKEPMFRRTTIARPPSEATEIFDTDFESDYDDILDSPRRSVGSVSFSFWMIADHTTNAW